MEAIVICGVKLKQELLAKHIVAAFLQDYYQYVWDISYAQAFVGNFIKFAMDVMKKEQYLDYFSLFIFNET